jgi:hypothetical protein
MSDTTATIPLADFDILPARKLLASVDAVLTATGEDFVTEAVEALDLGFDGIPGDFHAGVTRRSGGREPWYPRGTEMRNERQLSIVAADELAEIAAAMGIDRIEPEWIGANLVLGGVPRLSMLPSGTHALLLRRRDDQGRRAERTLPPRRAFGGEESRHGGRRGGRAAFSQARAAVARPRRLGGEARPHRARRTGLGSHPRAVALPRIGAVAARPTARRGW